MGPLVAAASVADDAAVAVQRLRLRCGCRRRRRLGGRVTADGAVVVTVSEPRLFRCRRLAGGVTDGCSGPLGAESVGMRRRNARLRRRVTADGCGGPPPRLDGRLSRPLAELPLMVLLVTVSVRASCR